jgi:hypothetical protein
VFQIFALIIRMHITEMSILIYKYHFIGTDKSQCAILVFFQMRQLKTTHLPNETNFVWKNLSHFATIPNDHKDWFCTCPHNMFTDIYKKMWLKSAYKFIYKKGVLSKSAWDLPVNTHQVWLDWSLVIMKRFHVALKFLFNWTRLHYFSQFYN